MEYKIMMIKVRIYVYVSSGTHDDDHSPILQGEGVEVGGDAEHTFVVRSETKWGVTCDLFFCDIDMLEERKRDLMTAWFLWHLT